MGLGSTNSLYKTSLYIKNQNKTITKNGIYTYDDGYTGLGTVTVNVPSSGDVMTFEAVNGLGRSPEVGEKVFAQEVNQQTAPVGSFGNNVSYYPRLLLNTLPLRGIYPTRAVYSYNDTDGSADEVYQVNLAMDFIRYLPNYKCYNLPSASSVNTAILRENDYSVLSLPTNYSGIINENYCYDANNGTQKIYKLTDDAVGEEVADLPFDGIYPKRMIGLNNSNIFYIEQNGYGIPYEIDLESKTCNQLHDGSPINGFNAFLNATIDNKFLIVAGYNLGFIYKINDDYSLEVDGRITLDGNVSFNQYNGILCTSHDNNNTLPPSVFKYENGYFTQLQFDTTGTEQPQYHYSLPTVNADGSYLLSTANTFSYLYKLDKSSGGYKAVECIRNNFTTEGITATVISGNEVTLTLKPSVPKI